MPNTSRRVAQFLDRIRDREVRIGVIGLGYVGVPLAIAAAGAGFRVLGFDINPERVTALNAGRSEMAHLPDEDLARCVATGRFEATSDMTRLDEPDALVIAVPTPLTRQREPDLGFVRKTAEAIAARLRVGQLIILESTTWPGTTAELVAPILARSGLQGGVDYFLAFSPEREDPGNARYTTSRIPRVVGADDASALALASALYGAFVDRVVTVSSTRAAEAVKLTENIFRSVNVALVNELKVIYDAMGIDVWEVIEAAKTKPFGFMPFYPGPGLGGHCIPIDPFYLTWKAREFDIATRFIELAGEINTAMPGRVVARLAEALDRQFGRGLSGARVLIIGMAYKKNVSDTRESPALVLFEKLAARGANVAYHDPLVPVIPPTREHRALTGIASIALSAEALADHDVVLIATDHDDIDYALLVEHARMIVDTRNACAARGLAATHIVKA